MTQEEIVEFVQNNARYYNDDSFEPYAVLFQGESFWWRISTQIRGLEQEVSLTLICG